MRTDWVPISASALVIGAMSLVFGVLLNPSMGGDTAVDTLRVVQESGGRWLAMAVMYFFASVTLTLGLPTLLLVLGKRGHKLGLAGIAVFSIGTIGTSGFAMLMVFFRAMVQVDAVRVSGLDNVGDDTGLKYFLYTWIGGFYVGLLLVALALFLGGATRRWVPALLVVFVVMLPFASSLGRVGSAVQVMALAVAFTGVAMTAVTAENKRDATAVRVG